MQVGFRAGFLLPCVCFWRGGRAVTDTDSAGPRSTRPDHRHRGLPARMLNSYFMSGAARTGAQVRQGRRLRRGTLRGPSPGLVVLLDMAAGAARSLCRLPRLTRSTFTGTIYGLVNTAYRRHCWDIGACLWRCITSPQQNLFSAAAFGG